MRITKGFLGLWLLVGNGVCFEKWVVVGGRRGSQRGLIKPFRFTEPVFRFASMGNVCEYWYRVDLGLAER